MSLASFFFLLISLQPGKALDNWRRLWKKKRRRSFILWENAASAPKWFSSQSTRGRLHFFSMKLLGFKLPGYNMQVNTIAYMWCMYTGKKMACPYFFAPLKPPERVEKNAIVKDYLCSAVRLLKMAGVVLLQALKASISQKSTQLSILTQ